MRTRIGLVFFVGLELLITGRVEGAEPVLRVVKSGGSGAKLLQNGDFEQAAGGKLAGWTAAPQGYSMARGEGRNGSQALRCENPNGRVWVGASQGLELNRVRLQAALAEQMGRVFLQEVPQSVHHDIPPMTGLELAVRKSHEPVALAQDFIFPEQVVVEHLVRNDALGVVGLPL